MATPFFAITQGNITQYGHFFGHCPLLETALAY